MTVQIQGNGGTVAEVDGTSFRAQRIVTRPIEYTTNGHYSSSAITGIIPAALTANSEIFQFRWTASTIAIINRVRISAAVSTTMFAAGVPVQLGLYKSTGWSVAGTGGTSVAISATCKDRTTMASTAVGDFRIATTAALGAGTKTLEANPFAAIAAPGPVTGSLNGQIIAPGTVMMEANVANGAHPMVLVANEGFSLVSIAVPATGTWMLSIEVLWAEAAQY